MLNTEGRIVGEFSVARTGDDEFFLFGSQAAEVHHSRWFMAHLPPGSPIRFEVLALSLVGLSAAGPHARDVLQSVTATSLATADFPFMAFRRLDVGMVPAWVGRMTYTGDLGYEIWVAPEYQRALFDLLWDAGRPYGMALFGFRALMSLRMEKRFGTWFREFRPIYTPLEAGMERYLKLDHDFVGRAALEAEMVRGPERRLVYLEVDPDPDEPADVIGDEPIWHDANVVGWVTSGAYAHYSQRSLALGYVPAQLAVSGAEFEVEIIGHRRPARLLDEPVLDPAGDRMRT
jgi:dimethylglycine dehydrogenase